MQAATPGNRNKSNCRAYHWYYYGDCGQCIEDLYKTMGLVVFYMRAISMTLNWVRANPKSSLNEMFLFFGAQDLASSWLTMICIWDQASAVRLIILMENPPPKHLMVNGDASQKPCPESTMQSPEEFSKRQTYEYFIYGFGLLSLFILHTVYFLA